MAIYLQSQSNTTLYFNGSIIEKLGITLSLFGPITNARDFISRDEAIQVSEVIDVPVTIVEV